MVPDMSESNRNSRDNIPAALPGDALAGRSFRGSQYDNQQRIEAAVHYLVHGSLTKAAKACSIPLTTLYDWKNS